MAGAILDRQLTETASNRFRFCVAGPQHDQGIRRLLRENPLPGEITLSFEREPDYFLGSRLPGSDDQTILAFDHKQLVCMGRCSTRDRFLNGEPRRVGYLSELRLDSRVQGRFDIVRRGYRFFEDLACSNPADYYFTSISSDNIRSLRLLERGLPGMPAYQFLNEFITLLVPVPDNIEKAKRLSEQTLHRLETQGIHCTTASTEHLHDLAHFLNTFARQNQLSACWCEEHLLALAGFGLSPGDFLLLSDGSSIIACATLWDQRLFKQTVVRGYSSRLSLLRPLVNLAGHFLGTPHLPEPNSTLAHAFLSPFAVLPQHQALLPDLVRISFASAADRNIQFLTLGFPAHHVGISSIRAAFSCRSYSTHLYQVLWPKLDSPLAIAEAHPIFPEIALL